MAAPRRRREIFANPFFAVLLVTSIVFVVTVLGYLVSPSVLVPDAAKASSISEDAPKSSASIAVAEWLDRNAPKALAIEIVVMLATGVLAMATDSWFSERSKPKPSP
jgi:hypothetical protein